MAHIENTTEVFNPEVIDWGMDRDALLQLFGEGLMDVIEESLKGVQIIKIADDFEGLVDFFHDPRILFCDNGAFNAVVYSPEVLPNLVLKLPLYNPSGRDVVLEILERFKFSQKRIAGVYKNIRDNLNYELYDMVYKHHGSRLGIMHKVVAHNRFFTKYGNESKRKHTLGIPSIVTVGNIPVGYTQTIVWGIPGFSQAHYELLEEMDCNDGNLENIRIPVDPVTLEVTGEVPVVIDIFYPQMRARLVKKV